MPLLRKLLFLHDVYETSVMLDYVKIVVLNSFLSSGRVSFFLTLKVDSMSEHSLISKFKPYLIQFPTPKIQKGEYKVNYIIKHLEF